MFWVLIPSRGKRFCSLPKFADYLWGLPSLIFNDFDGYFSKNKVARALKLTSHLCQVLRLQKTWAMSVLSVCVFTAWTETTWPFLICRLSNTMYRAVKIVLSKEAGSNRMLKKNFIMRSCMNVYILPTIIGWSNGEVCNRQGTWNIQGWRERHTGWEEKYKRTFEDLGIDGPIRLKYILQK